MNICYFRETCPHFYLPNVTCRTGGDDCKYFQEHLEDNMRIAEERLAQLGQPAHSVGACDLEVVARLKGKAGANVKENI